MPKALIRLRLLVSCSSELHAERGLLDAVVQDVNRVTEDAHGVTLRTIDWRRDMVPGAGLDPQEVINSQSSDYEIYFGMLGTRFGTPTTRAGSGTEEEFNLAYRRFREAPTSVRLLFYFRTGHFGAVLDIDPDQLKKVQEFRTRLGREAGVLYCEFGTPEEFMQLCRHHLIQLVSTQWNVTEWAAVPGLEPLRDQAQLVEEPEPMLADEEDEPGILDLRVRHDDAFEATRTSIGKLAEFIATSVETDRAWTADLKARSGRIVSPRDAQTLLNAKAADFSRRAGALRQLRAAYRASSDEYFDALLDLVSFQIQTGLSPIHEMKEGLLALVALDSVVRAARDTYAGVARSVETLPEPTRVFRAQKRALRKEFENLSADIGAWLDRSAEVRSRFQIEGQESTTEGKTV